jgi:hypothetical protein
MNPEDNCLSCDIQPLYLYNSISDELRVILLKSSRQKMGVRHIYPDIFRVPTSLSHHGLELS